MANDNHIAVLKKGAAAWNAWAAERKEAVKAERAKRTRNRLTLRVLIEDWNRLHLASRRPSYAAEAVRAINKRTSAPNNQSVIHTNKV